MMCSLIFSIRSSAFLNTSLWNISAFNIPKKFSATALSNSFFCGTYFVLTLFISAAFNTVYSDIANLNHQRLFFAFLLKPRYLTCWNRHSSHVNTLTLFEKRMTNNGSVLMTLRIYNQGPSNFHIGQV